MTSNIFKATARRNRVHRNLCNSPLNLPPLELKYEPILNGSGRKRDTSDTEIKN